MSVSQSLWVTRPVPLCSPPRLSRLLRPPHPRLFVSHPPSMSPRVSCLLMSLCLFCFPLHNLPFFPPLPSPQRAGPSGWLGEGRRGWGTGASQAFCLPFVSQRTWENCSLSRGGSQLHGQPLPSPSARSRASSLSPTLPAAGEGGLELGRGLSEALKGSLSKGGRVSAIRARSSGAWGMGC